MHFMTREPMLHNYDDCERREVVPFIPPGAKRILDVGCARGGFGALLTDREVYGVEPNPEAATVAAKRYRHVYRGVFPDVVPEGEVFDCTIFNDVLEHLVDPYAAVRDCRDYLAMDGHVVASIPNMRYVQVLKRLLFNADWTYTDVGVLDRTHLRWFTHKTMRSLFEENGFTVETLAPINVHEGRCGKVLIHIRPLADLAALQFVVVAKLRTIRD